MKKVSKYLPIAIMAFLLIGLSSCKNENKNQKEVTAYKNEEVAMAKTAEVETAKGYTIGDEATDFKLKDVDGDMVSLSDYPDAKGFIVIFTCNTCPFAVACLGNSLTISMSMAASLLCIICTYPTYHHL